MSTDIKYLRHIMRGRLTDFVSGRDSSGAFGCDDAGNERTGDVP